jgi:hypothetical protein
VWMGRRLDKTGSGLRRSVRPDALDHDKGLGVGHEASAPYAAGELPDPSAIGGVQRHVSAIETQADVGGRSAAVEDMTGEPHDRRRVVDAQPVAFAAKSDVPGWLRGSPDGVCGHAHGRYSLLTPPRMVPAPGLSAGDRIAAA